MDPRKSRKLVRRWALPVVLITLVGGVVAYGVTSRIAPVYQAHATVRVVAPLDPFGASGVVLLYGDQTTLLPAASLITEPWVLQRVIDELRLNTTIDQLSRRVTAVPMTNTQLVNVTVLDRTASLATRIANTLSSDVVERVNQQNDQRVKAADAPYELQILRLTSIVNAEVERLGRTPRTQDTSGLSAEISVISTALASTKNEYATLKATQPASLETVSIATPAQQPAQPASPSIALNLAVGLLAGLVMALGIATLAEYLNRRGHSRGVGSRHDRSW